MKLRSKQPSKRSPKPRTPALSRFFSWVLLLVLLLTPALSGCHSARKAAVFTVPDTFDTSKTYDITFWAKNDTNKNQVMIYEKAVEDFEALYPNIQVNIRFYTDYQKIYQDVITNIATQTTPNVCISYPDHISTYLTGNEVMVSLDELMANEKYGLGGSELRFGSPAKDEIVPQFLRECDLGGHCYALPFVRSTEACYINKTYVEKLGYTVPDVLTWDFIWEVSDKAAQKAEDGTFLLNGQKVLIPFIYKSTDNMMIQMLRQKDAGYSTDLGEIRLFNDTTEELLYTVADHVKTGSFSTFKISGYPANFLNAGQCVFAVDSTAGATWMGSDAPLCDISEDKIVQFETVVRTVPQFDPEHPSMISQGPSVCVFNKSDPQEVLASWLFAQYLLTDPVQTAYAETEGYVPVTLTAQNSADYQSYLSLGGTDNDVHYQIKIDATKLLLSHTSDTFVTPVFNGSASLREAAGQLIERVTNSVRRKETVDDAYLETMYNDTTVRYHLTECGISRTERQDLGTLPPTATALLISLGVVWVLIGLFFVRSKIKEKKRK